VWLTGLWLVAAPLGSALAAVPTAEAYKYVAVIAGECQRLVVAGADHSTECSDKLVNVDFGDGRVAFVFSTPSDHGTVITSFLGRSSTQQNLRTYRLDVDEITTTTTDAAGRPDNVVERAAGHCAMTGDPTRESARFECSAERSGGTTGKTTATFVSAGVPTVYAGTRGAPDAIARDGTR
jgi:hypothetical protein